MRICLLWGFLLLGVEELGRPVAERPSSVNYFFVLPSGTFFLAIFISGSGEWTVCIHLVLPGHWVVRDFAIFSRIVQSKIIPESNVNVK
jgi:hypothetical protein